MRAWGKTDRGMIRRQNQDEFIIDIPGEGGCAVCVVCDGMGGALAGNVASGIAAMTYTAEVKQGLGELSDFGGFPDVARRAVRQANAAVYEKSRLDPECQGMGTTLVGATIRGRTAYVINVGDSRAYHITEGGIQRITKDHSVVEDMVDRGDLTPEEAKSHPSKNLITRALGTEEEILCDIFRLELKEGNYLLLCTDGLSNIVSEQELLYEVLHGGGVEDCCERMLEIANSRGAPDNVTVVLYEA